MQTDLDLKVVKRKVYMSYFQDGLWDILLGLYLLGWGLMVLTDFVAVMGGLWVTAYFTILGLKRRLTYPRAGYIKLAEARRQQIRMVILGVLLFFLGFAVFLLFNAGSRPEWLGEYFMLMLGTLMALVIAVLGYWWRVSRWYVYAGFIFVASAFHQWLDIPLNLSFLVPGGLITLYGIVLLFRFLRRYPKPTQEEKNFVS